MFYLFFPLLCWVFLKRSWGWPVFLAFLLGLVVFGPFARQPWYTTNEIWAYQSYLGNVDNIALGCLTAIAVERFWKNAIFLSSTWPTCLQIFGSLLSLFVVFEWPRIILGVRVWRLVAHSATDTTILGLGICLIMLGSVLRPTNGSRWTLPIRWLGRYSYEVYLTHEFVVMALLTPFLHMRKGPVTLWIAAVMLLSACLGYILSRFISEPLNRQLRGAPLPADLPPFTAAIPG